jgi:hypothetical protein
VRAWCERREIEKDADPVSLQLDRIAVQLETLADKLIDHVIDDETYQSKRGKLLLQRMDIEERQRKRERSATEPDRVQNFLELVKSLYSTYKIASKREKREIVELATSNRFVSPEYVAIEPRNWLSAVDNAVVVLCGAPHRPTSRNGREMSNVYVEQLIELSKNNEVGKISEVFEEMGGNTF